tara:strand:- start:220 stop:633 length:414 start_codon:yes stop_codon:yes gene_type:complete
MSLANSKSNLRVSKSKKNLKLGRKRYSKKRNRNKTKQKKYELSIIAPRNQEHIEAKYCSCIQKVRNKGKVNNPYGICTSSIFGSRNSIRDRVVDCAKYYDYASMNLQKLKTIAKEKKIKGYSKMKKNKLVNLLKSLK